MFERDVQRSALSWYWEQLRQHRARMARESIMLFQLVMKARACQMYEEDCWDESQGCIRSFHTESAVLRPVAVTSRVKKSIHA